MSRDLPAGWAWARVADLAEINSGSTPSNAEAQSEVSGEIPWFKVSSMNLQGNEIQMRDSLWWFNRDHAEKLGLRVIKSGSLIFPKLGGALLTNKRRVLAIDAAIDMNLMAITSYGPFQDYLNRFFDTLDMANFSDGSVVPQLKKSILQTIPIPLAPLPEQRRIVARIEELFAEIAEGEAALERAREGLDIWRRALLKAAVTGELTRDWRDANRPTEIGADLLARIRAETAIPSTTSRTTRNSASPALHDTRSLPELPDGWAWACLGEIIESLRRSRSNGRQSAQSCEFLRFGRWRLMPRISDILTKTRRADWENFVLNRGTCSLRATMDRVISSVCAASLGERSRSTTQIRSFVFVWCLNCKRSARFLRQPLTRALPENSSTGRSRLLLASMAFRELLSSAPQSRFLRLLKPTESRNCFEMIFRAPRISRRSKPLI
jgi:hypothetical protein